MEQKESEITENSDDTTTVTINEEENKETSNALTTHAKTSNYFFTSGMVNSFTLSGMLLTGLGMVFETSARYSPEFAKFFNTDGMKIARLVLGAIGLIGPGIITFVQNCCKTRKGYEAIQNTQLPPELLKQIADTIDGDPTLKSQLDNYFGKLAANQNVKVGLQALLINSGQAIYALFTTALGFEGKTGMEIAEVLPQTGPTASIAVIGFAAGYALYKGYEYYQHRQELADAKVNSPTPL